MNVPASRVTASALFSIVLRHTEFPPSRYVHAARRELAPKSPECCEKQHGGQFEHYQSARQRLMFIVPMAITLILILLYMTYQNFVDTFRVLTGIPFACTGGIIALWIRDMPFSISAAIGFVALSGVAVLDDMLLVTTIRRFRRLGMGLEKAVEQAAMTRLRPVLMTTLVAAVGFLPMAINTGIGAEVQRPLATVVIGGVISAMIMSLLVLRVLYSVFAGVTGDAMNDSRSSTLEDENERVSEVPQNPVLTSID